MEAILEELHKLTIPELRQKIKDEGQPMGPITATTRKLFERRLAQALYSKNNPEPPGEDTPDFSEDTGSRSASTETDSSDVTLSQPAVSGSNADGSTNNSDRGTEEGSQAQVEEEEGGETMYYAVSLPPSDVSLAAHANGFDPDQPHVYTKRSEALTTLKKVKGARFKAFKNRKDATDFSLQKTPPVQKTCEADAEAAKAEKANNFKAPKVPELNRLRKSFEQGDKVTFTETVWNNPRFLISSGDTPVILQEGSRWSALHVAAKANLPNMCELVLDILQDHEFLQLMYTDLCTPCRKGGPPKAFYIDGDQPTKLDLDVFLALQGITIPAEKYPNIVRWKGLITSFTEHARQNWPSPAGLQRQRRHTFSTRSPLAAPCMMTGSLPRPGHRETTDSVIDDLKQELFRGESPN
ncbi:PREDICTED: LOW QUALITY PROTEIN: ankyrin repeat and LEM domain-containing protein 2-like [Branchiostoma belcheri]|uniref:LOW QUALITY PROTEIN: ankyrin repeat and LEM domain-containing protein 2-like n=1 Tax=Branchiostoma belcheri TaxID=7741 RepID=A0A6P4ZXK2_BRABE|nr:PREDICTED: LOW QUALITY PROTEIN: ankyrin repeat and LEM domain-containing protein 2-like [Branchiostoma belcheri]